MQKIYNNLIELIGNTPLVRLANIEKLHNLESSIYAKIESFNPGGSVKDRATLYMIEGAERDGKIKPGNTIIEPTSGNTGIGLAWIGKLKGYKTILTMPESMSIERRKLLLIYGAQIVLTPALEGMKGAIAKAEELNKEIENSIILSQFSNPDNPNAHYQTTANEIWEATNGNIDILVSGVGTGGTLCGTSKRLKEYNPKIKSIAIEPASSPVLSGGKPSAHKIQGIGAGFIPNNYCKELVDKVITVEDNNAINTARELASTEGILAGISSGAALWGAIEVAKANSHKNIIVILPDTGERYLSTQLFDN